MPDGDPDTAHVPEETELRPRAHQLPPLASALAGQRILVTGATGFLGTALVERLLRSVPDCSVAVLVRPGRRASAAARAQREILRNDCFDRLRAELGDTFDEVAQRRLVVITGDVGTDGLGLDDIKAHCHAGGKTSRRRMVHAFGAGQRLAHCIVPSLVARTFFPNGIVHPARLVNCNFHFCHKGVIVDVRWPVPAGTQRILEQALVDLDRVGNGFDRLSSLKRK